jgi:shikimate kinase
MDPRTRAEIREKGISVWLRADLDLLVRRTQRRGTRPLLNVPDPAARLAELIEQRYPFYAEADVTVDSDDSPPEVTVERVIAALRLHLEDSQPRGSAA